MASSLLALLLVALLALAAGGWWLWHSDTGWARVLLRVPGLSLDGVQGRPTGGPLAIRRLDWQRAGLHITVEGLAWDDAQWRWRPHEGAWLGLQLQQARAARVQVRTTRVAGASPVQPPTSLRLPLALQAPGLRVGALVVDTQAPVTDIAADLHLGARAGTEHRVERLQFQRDGLAFGGQVVLGTTSTGSAPGDGLPLQARLQAAPPPDAQHPWRAALGADGTLGQLAIDARLRGAGATARVQATLAPFAPWPLLSLAAQAEALDLAALSPGWPQTRLSGRATLAELGRTQAATDPVVLQLALANLEPGPWDAGRLPLRGLQSRLQLQLTPATLVFERLQLQLAGRRDAGTLQGTGHWQGGRLDTTLQLDGVRPEQLHTRLPPMVLAGPVTLAVQGLPAPSPGGPAHASPDGITGQLNVDLQGRMPRRGAPALALQAEGGFVVPSDGRLQLLLRQAQASAGPARAQASATADRSAAGAWRVQSRGELVRFDPGLWWPAAAGGRGADRLDGRWQADLAWPAPPLPDALAGLRGSASITLDESRWAGLGWRGLALLEAGPAALQIDADLRAGPNRLQARGQLPTDRRTAPTGHLDLQAPALAALAPLAALLPAAAAELWPRQGALSAQARVEGRWPALRSEGRLAVQRLQSPLLAVGRADARWNLSTLGPDAPLSLQLQARDVSRGVQRLTRLEAALQGSLRRHTLRLQADSPLRPPAWAEAAAGAPGDSGSTMLLQGSGAWTPARAGGGTWQGRIAQLRAAPRSAPGAPWLQADDLQATLVLGPGGALQRAALAPGRLQGLGGALAWQQAQWQPALRTGAPPRITLQAELEPLQVAPWLARWQPQFGWRGDLALAGRIDVRNGERFDADVLIERRGGDLSLTVEGATRALGLSDLRLGLSAHGGRWQFTQAVVGSSVGVLGGQQSLVTSPQAAWPAADTPLDGGMSLNVPQLAVWAPWLPPGWRLGGELRIGASFGGRFSAPEYRGEIRGENLAVRNLFQGIHLEQGQLVVALAGTQATVQQFVFRDGAGTGVLRVTGNAGFGGTPQAALRVAAERLRVLDRYDRRVTVSGGAGLQLGAEQMALDGSFTIDEGLIDATQDEAPSLPADVVVYNRAPLPGAPGAPGGAARPAAPAGASPLGAATVDLRIDLGQQLRLRGRGLDTLLRGQLRLTTPGGQLAVNGVIRAEEGTYTAYGQNLRIERGTLVFGGEVGNPRLDILALRADIDTRVGVLVTGTAGNPRIRLYSEPELGEMDTLTWLVLGRAPEGLGRDDAALLQRAALALLAGERGGNGGLVQRLGLDELSVGRTGNGNGQAADTIVSLGKQVSRRVYVGYEHALGTAGGTWQLIYRIAGRLTLRARTGYENAIDVIWTWRWD